MQLRVEFSRREKGRKKAMDNLLKPSGARGEATENSQIKWELQQYPTYPELLENRSSKLMLFFSTTESKCFFPKMETLKAHSSLFHVVMELETEDTCRAIFPGND